MMLIDKVVRASVGRGYGSGITKSPMSQNDS